MVKLLGILNVTPDSFSDGGQYNAAPAAISRCETLIREGADIIDIGAESTRPGALPLSFEQEWQRLAPILPHVVTLAHQHHRLVSLDTYHPENAQRAIALGVDWINDVTGLTQPPMRELARVTKNPFIVMHHLGIPADSMRTIPKKLDPVEVIKQWINRTRTQLEKEKIDPSRIIFDPGIGFGKTPAQSIQLITHIDRLTACTDTLLVGHSRKSFLSSLYPNLSAARDAETLMVSQLLVENGVAFLRVHDIAGHRSAFPL